MLKRSYSWIVILLLLTGCANHGSQTASPQTKTAMAASTQSHRLAAFSKVDVQGRINISLHTGYKQPQVILKGDPRDLAQVRVLVKNNTAYVSLGNGFPQFGAVNAIIQTNSLTGVRYVGAGTITSGNLYTRWLDLSIDNPGTTRLNGTIGLRQLDVNGGGLVQINGVSSRSLTVHFTKNPKVQLHGMVNLTRLDLDGGGWLSLYWVKSDRLVINAKKRAKIQLAGIVNRLEVELWDRANFKGRYLRAKRTFVKTHGRSVAEISSVNHQSSLATDASDIYYYNLPDTRADFMAYKGSVLDMREWSTHDFEEFTRYNKQFP